MPVIGIGLYIKMQNILQYRLICFSVWLNSILKWIPGDFNFQWITQSIHTYYWYKYPSRRKGNLICLGSVQRWDLGILSFILNNAFAEANESPFIKYKIHILIRFSSFSNLWPTRNFCVENFNNFWKSEMGTFLWLILVVGGMRCLHSYQLHILPVQTGAQTVTTKLKAQIKLKVTPMRWGQVKSVTSHPSNI